VTDCAAVRVDIGARGANDGAGRDKHRDRVLGDIENLVGSDELIDGIRGDYLDDAFFGGRGNDILDARDESRDRMLNCGPGRDRLRRDEVNPSGGGCERISTTSATPEAVISRRSSAVEGPVEILW